MLLDIRTLAGVFSSLLVLNLHNELKVEGSILTGNGCSFKSRSAKLPFLELAPFSGL